MAFAGQAQGFGPEGGIRVPAFARLGTVFQGIEKIRPYSVQIYPTTSFLLHLIITMRFAQMSRPYDIN